MSYVIVGAGAVGGVLGGLLADAGRDVTLVARGAHAAAMERDGLTVGRPDGPVHVRPPVVTAVTDLRLTEDDVLLLCTKSQDSAPLLAELAALPVGGRTAGEVLPLVSVQNGVSNEPEALRRFADVHGICVLLPATHLEPGRVDGTAAPLAGLLDSGRFPSGTTEVDHRLAADLSASGFGSVPREDVMAWKRAKLLRNLGNALEALTGDSAAESDDVRRLNRLAGQEGRACFEAAGLGWVRAPEWDAYRADRSVERPVEGRRREGGSTWQSVARGLGSVETDYLNGEVIRLGRLHGVPTPVNELLQREVNALAHRRARPGSVRAAQLLAALT
ncbi:MAG: 2-dehydropantoate 2-reductase [Frankiales bacterium]|nr:2-dehydropantoate 2-reductase [Frankiales bacterium]